MGKRNRGKKKGSGGLLIGLRGGFKNAARTATGIGESGGDEEEQPKPPSRIRKIIDHAITVALLALVGAIFLHRCGIVKFK